MTPAGENSPSPANLRISPRKILSGSARLLGQDAVPKKVTITDISKGGMGMFTEETIAAGDPCAIAFDVTLRSETKRINVWAKVAYCMKEGEKKFKVGVRFLDFDSYSRMHIDQLCQTGNVQAGW